MLVDHIFCCTAALSHPARDCLARLLCALTVSESACHWPSFLLLRLAFLDSCARVDQKITVIMGEMQKLEAQRSFVKERLEQARQDLRAASQLDQSNKLALDKKVRVCIKWIACNKWKHYDETYIVLYVKAQLTNHQTCLLSRKMPCFAPVYAHPCPTGSILVA